MPGRAGRVCPEGHPGPLATKLAPVPRTQQKATDDTYNAAVLAAAATNGTNAAVSLASLGAGAVAESLGVQTAVSSVTSAVLESFVKTVGQNLAAGAIQYVANQGLNINDLGSNTVSNTTKTAILSAMRDYQTNQAMQGSTLTGSALDQARQQVASNLDSVYSNLGNYIGLVSTAATGNSLIDQILIDQNHIEDLRALSNKITGDISIQEAQFESTTQDLDNARSALNYCRGLHPEYSPSGS